MIRMECRKGVGCQVLDSPCPAPDYLWPHIYISIYRYIYISIYILYIYRNLLWEASSGLSLGVTSALLALHACGQGGCRCCCTKPTFDSSLTGGASIPHWFPRQDKPRDLKPNSSPLKGALGLPGWPTPIPFSQFFSPSLVLPFLGICNLPLASHSLFHSPLHPIQKFDFISTVFLFSTSSQFFVLLFLLSLTLTIEWQNLFTNGNLDPRW